MGSHNQGVCDQVVLYEHAFGVAPHFCKLKSGSIHLKRFKKIIVTPPNEAATKFYTNIYYIIILICDL
jgi:hypothetical protein